MKKLLVLILVAISLFSLVSCKQPPREYGKTPEEICTNCVLETKYKDVNVIDTICRYWDSNEEADIYLVQVDSSVGNQGNSEMWYVSIKYVKEGEKISRDELIDCSVTGKVG